jgi:sugar diacid utilization regulator
VSDSVLVADGAAGTSRRDALSSLRSLLVLAQLMTESNAEHQIFELSVGAARSFVAGSAAGIILDEDLRYPSPEELADVNVSGLEDYGGAVTVRSRPWGWAYPLRALPGRFGWLVVGAADEPDSEQQFLLRALAQQTGSAVANLRLHEQERRATAELATANAALEQTLEALRYSMTTHERLTTVAASGEGREGLARAVHELTGHPVAIEDRYGNLRAWAGPNCPDPYPKDPAARREQLLRRALREKRPIRDGGRLLAVTQPQKDVLGVIVLVDPAGTAGDQQLMALEHAGTVLAMELARLRSLAESELRLRRDLVDELLTGTDEESALRRAQALGYDLERPHRVVIVEGRSTDRDEAAFLHATRRAARDEPAGTLLVSRGQQVVLLADHEVVWEHLRQSILRELGGGRCRIGVGERCTSVRDLPASFRQAELALRIQHAASFDDQATAYDDLGVYQLLADVEDPNATERFVRKWLGDLLDYDAKRNGDLVATLSRYLECGGSYEETSEALFIHRSTLKYRLQRIRSIGAYDLTDPDTRFNLHLACRAWDTLRALRGQPGEAGGETPGGGRDPRRRIGASSGVPK